MTSDDSVPRDLGTHRPILGMAWVVYGVIRLVMAFWLFYVMPTAKVMFGALLVRVPDPFTLMSVFHFIYAVAIVLSALCGFFGLLAGLALLSGWRSGRRLALIAGFMALSNIPVGTTLGIYTLIVFLPSSSGQLYGHAGQAH